MVDSRYADVVDEWFNQTLEIYAETETSYGVAEQMSSRLPVTEGGIQEMIQYIEEQYSEKRLLKHFGILISACVNMSLTEGITLSVNTPFSYIGLNNNNELTIDGNLNMCTGEGMVGGKLTINGNVGMYLGSGLQGGNIMVDGDCGGDMGSRMIGGEITINGSCGRDATVLAKGGRVNLNGSVKSICEYTEATVIYYSDKIMTCPELFEM